MPAVKKVDQALSLTKQTNSARKASLQAKSAILIAGGIDDETNNTSSKLPSGKPFHANWRNSGEYPPPNCKNEPWLAWEFLRRNKEYAKHVRQMLALPPGEFDNRLTSKGDACLDGVNCTPAAKPGETVKHYYKRIKAESDGKKKGSIQSPRLTVVVK